MEVSRIEKCVNSETLFLLPFFKWLPEILAVSFALQNFTLFFSSCLVTVLTKKLGKMEKLLNVLKSVCGECYPVVTNYYDQLAFS